MIATETRMVTTVSPETFTSPSIIENGGITDVVVFAAEPKTSSATFCRK